MLQNFRIRTKLLLHQALIAFPGLLLIGFLGYTTGKSALEQQVFKHLTSVRASKASQIETYFRRVRRQVEVFSENRMVVEAMRELQDGFRELAGEPATADRLAALRDHYGQEFLPRLSSHEQTTADVDAYLPRGGAASYLQYHYLAANPYPTGRKDRYDDAADASAYTRAHLKFHPGLRSFTRKFGYYDLFLIDAEGGDVVYSVFKETDFATRLTDGPYRESGLAAAFGAVRAAPDKDGVRLADFAPYAPSHGAPASFVASPIHDGQERLGVLAFQMPVDEINRIMTGDMSWRADGLGDSGETYLVGPDYTMRSISRFLLEDPEGYFAALAGIGTAASEIERIRRLDTTILLQEVRTTAAEEALDGTFRTAVIDDYRGVPVLSSFAPLAIDDVDWVILSEIDTAEVFAPIQAFARGLWLAASVMLALLAVLVVGFARSFMKPINALAEGAERFGRGDEQVEIRVESGDELGLLAKAFNRMIASIRDKSARLEQAFEDNERLLLNILPASVAERLKDGGLGTRFGGVQKTVEAQQRGTVEALAAYVPMDRRQALAAGSELAEHSEGTVLFADISGFTPLTEALARELGARQGAEETIRHINRVYGALIGEIHRMRGSVIGFSGDAVTCWLDGDDGRRAVACATNIQQLMSWFAALETPSGETFPLAVKVAVTRGRVRRLLAGAPEVQLIDVLAGAALDRVAVAEGLAEKGEIVVGPEVLESLGEKLHLVEERHDEAGRRFGVVDKPWAAPELEPWAPLAADALDLEQVRPWLLPPIYQRLRGGQGEFLADLRPVAPLFLKFVGLDFEDDDEVGAKLDTFLRWVQGVVERYQGSLIQVTTGDKGSYLYAVFGAPVAHEDAAERAVTAALEVRTPPPEASYVEAVSIGLGYGRMRTGAYGSDTRRTYGVLGDQVNLAARLMSRAEPGQVLASRQLADAAGTGCQFKNLGKVVVKGKLQGVEIFEAVARLGAATQQMGFSGQGPRVAVVGRSAERQVLGKALLALETERQSTTLVIAGEAGLGKSLLLSDLLKLVRVWDSEAGDDGPEVWPADADAIETSTAYYAWRPVLRRALGLGDAGDDEAARAKVLAGLQAMDPKLAGLAPLLEAALPLGFADNRRTASLPGPQRAESTRKLLARLRGPRGASPPAAGGRRPAARRSPPRAPGDPRGRRDPDPGARAAGAGGDGGAGRPVSRCRRAAGAGGGADLREGRRQPVLHPRARPRPSRRRAGPRRRRRGVPRGG